MTYDESPLEHALKVVTLLIQQKLLFQSKQDLMGLVLFGTDETNNRLSQDGFYEHITVVKELSKPDLEMIRFIDQINPEGAQGDFIDALIVALDMIIDTTGTRKFQKRIFLLTDAGCPANADDVDAVAKEFRNRGAKLNVIAINFGDPGSSSTKKANESILKKLCDDVQGAIVPIDEAIGMMSAFRRKPIAQRPAFRVDLDVSPLISFPIASYLKTRIATFPSMKKLSKISESSAHPGSMGVKLDRMYRSIAEDDVEVPAHERAKGYRYGKSIVPFSPMDHDALAYRAIKGMKLIGFTSAQNVPRQHFMSNVHCIMPDKNDESASIAMSAIIHALAETGSVGIVRLVKSVRVGSGPQLGALLPNIKPSMECLYYVQLPFVEDIRQYPFATLDVDRIQRKHQPSAEQLSVAEQLIRQLDLTSAGADEDGNPMEACKPKDTYNPALQYFYQCVEHRSLGGAGLPPVDPAITRYCSPDEDLFDGARSAIQQFRNAFPLTRAERTEKKEKRYWSERWMDAAAHVGLDSYAPGDGGAKAKKKAKTSASSIMADDGGALSMAGLVSGGTYDVGHIHPAQDFRDMLARRDVDLVDKAISQMKERVIRLVDDSIRDQLYPKALECIRVLRQGCIQEEEAEQFNQTLTEMRGHYRGKRRDDFWQLIKARASGISLITHEESEDSSVTPEQAKAFFASQHDGQDQMARGDGTQEGKAGEATADDLFGMLE